jgi:Phosphotransferase enzyme family
VIEERVSRLAGADVRALRPIRGGGYAASFRAVAELADGRTVFVKAGAEEVTSGFLRDEQRVYAALSGPFMPELVGMDEGEPPLLVLEDLSTGHWPPPWDEPSIAAVQKTLAAIAATAAPEWLQPIAVEADWLLGGWAVIERDPEPFLSLEVCSAAWLERSLPVLRDAAETAPIEGEALLHLDVRSDNICLAERGAVFVDWNWAHLGNPALDLAFWLPSLADEGGPRPEELLPGAGELAAAVAGFFGARAGLPPPATAPHVRSVQLSQLQVALPWAVKELDLPPPS